MDKLNVFKTLLYRQMLCQMCRVVTYVLFLTSPVLSFVPRRSGDRDRYGRLRQYRRSMSRDRDRRRRRSRDEDKFKGSLSEGMKADQESSGEEV